MHCVCKLLQADLCVQSCACKFVCTNSCMRILVCKDKHVNHCMQLFTCNPCVQTAVCKSLHANHGVQTFACKSLCANDCMQVMVCKPLHATHACKSLCASDCMQPMVCKPLHANPCVQTPMCKPAALGKAAGQLPALPANPIYTFTALEPRNPSLGASTSPPHAPLCSQGMSAGTVAAALPGHATEGMLGVTVTPPSWDEPPLLPQKSRGRIRGTKRGRVRGHREAAARQACSCRLHTRTPRYRRRRSPSRPSPA